MSEYIVFSLRPQLPNTHPVWSKLTAGHSSGSTAYRTTPGTRTSLPRQRLWRRRGLACMS